MTKWIGNNIFVDWYCQENSNPTWDNVLHAADRSVKPDVLLAIGGGSVIDVAKCARQVLATKVKNIDILSSTYWDELNSNSCQGKPLIAIPTTAGTGSEASFWAVITNKKKKVNIGGPMVAPSYALVDPVLTYTLPWDITLYTALDALTHGIEAYISKNSNPISDALALKAIKMVASNLPLIAEDINSKKAREGLHYASLMAGIAFNNSDLTGVHSLGESLGGFYNITHGFANAVVLPEMMKYNATAVPDKMKNIITILNNDSYQDITEDIETATYRTFDTYNKRFNLPSIKSIGIRNEDIDKLVNFSIENVSTPSNPKPLNKDVFKNIITKMIEADGLNN